MIQTLIFRKLPSAYEALTRRSAMLCHYSPPPHAPTHPPLPTHTHTHTHINTHTFSGLLSPSSLYHMMTLNSSTSLLLQAP